jgi:hypothetical protein
VIQDTTWGAYKKVLQSISNTIEYGKIKKLIENDDKLIDFEILSPTTPLRIAFSCMEYEDPPNIAFKI